MQGDKRNPGQIKNLVLAPEASTNWLFSGVFISNILKHHIVIYMDVHDYKKYKRISTLSDLNFIKFFLLTALWLKGILCLIDYRDLYHRDLMYQNFQQLDYYFSPSRFHRTVNHYQDKIIEAYLNYMEYISLKEAALGPITGDEQNNRHGSGDPSKKEYLREKESAENELKKIESSTNVDHDAKYVVRLCTKLLAAHAVAKKVNGVIFDSSQYQLGVTFLKKANIN